MKRLMLGLLAGMAAGAGLAFLLGPGGGGEGGGPEQRLRGLIDRARRSFEAGRGRARALAPRAGETAGGTVPPAAVQAQETARAAAASLLAPVQSYAEQLKARWREAVDQGKQASAATQDELRRRYRESTRRP